MLGYPHFAALNAGYLLWYGDEMTALTEKEAAVLDWLAGQREAMVELVGSLVNIDSGSYDKAGVDAVGAQLRGFLAVHGIGFDIVPDDRFGDAIRAGTGNGSGAGNAPVLLLGHRDTVFPQGEAGRIGWPS